MTFVCFGTFDLFHDMHRRLFRTARSHTDSILVYVYAKRIKPGNKVVSESAQIRILRVTRFLMTIFQRGHFQVLRMTKKHLEHVRDLDPREHVLFGGQDQFEYPELRNLCRSMGLRMCSMDRGNGPCSSDLRSQSALRHHCDELGVDVPGGRTFWRKYRPGTLGRAGPLTSRMSCLRYTPHLGCIDQTVTHALHEPTPGQAAAALFCLPGRTAVDWTRARKILRTCEDMLGGAQLASLYLVVYSEAKPAISTEYHAQQLRRSPSTYASEDARRFAYQFLLPRIRLGLPSILWCRSRGSVLALEVENALADVLSGTPSGLVQVMCVSNLAPLTPRRFRTVSFTGSTDRKAQQLVAELGERSPSLEQLCCIEHNHLSYVVDVPSSIQTWEHTVWTNFCKGEGAVVTIDDPDCHYTPLYISPRVQDGMSSIQLDLPHLVYAHFITLLTNAGVNATRTKI